MLMLFLMINDTFEAQQEHEQNIAASSLARLVILRYPNIYKWRLIYGLNEALIPFATHEHHNDLHNSLSVLHGI